MFLIDDCFPLNYNFSALRITVKEKKKKKACTNMGVTTALSQNIPKTPTSGDIRSSMSLGR